MIDPPTRKTQRFTSNMTISSVESMPEITIRSRLWFKVFFVVVSIISSAIGVIILLKHNYYLNPQYNFTHQFLLKIFIITFTLGVLSAIILSLLITLVIVMITSLFRLCFPRKPKSIEDDSVSFVGIAFVVFVIMMIILYLSAIPFSIYIIVKMLKDIVMKDYVRFFLLYVFISVNLLIGVVFLAIAIYSFLFTHVTTSTRSKYMVEEEDIAGVEKEIKEAYAAYHIEDKGKELSDIN